MLFVQFEAIGLQFLQVKQIKHISLENQLFVFLDSYWKQNRWDTFQQNDTITAHPLDGEIYAQIINLSCSYDVYFHGSMEVLDVSQQRYTFGSQFYATVNLLAQEILTADNAKQ